MREDLSAKQVIALYALRVQIEESFRNTKNIRDRWSFPHALPRSKSRYVIFYLLAALAGFVHTVIAIATEKKQLHLRYQRQEAVESYGSSTSARPFSPEPDRGHWLT
jgi:hypothetical protein